MYRCDPVARRDDSGTRGRCCLVALAKTKSGALNYGSAGNGSATHLAAELFKFMTGSDIVHVPYNGGGPAILALLGGQVSMSLSSIPPALGHIKSGKLIALGVSGAKRNAALPNVPPIAEAGAPGFEVTEWQGAVVPAGTTQAIIRRLNRELVAALKTPDVDQGRRHQAGLDANGPHDEH